MNRNRVRRTGAMMAMASFALVLLAACGGEQAHEDVTRVPTMSDAAAQATREAANAPVATPGAEGGTPVAGATPVAPGDEATAAAAVDVVSFDIYFEPAQLTISADTDVTMSLLNAGAAPHNFSIDELGISVDIAPGATEETTINAPAGTYEYYCNVPGHKQAGMVGTLIISKDAAAAPAGATPVPVAAEQDAAAGDATPTRATTQATPAAGVEQAAGAGAGRMQEPPDRRLAG